MARYILKRFSSGNQSREQQRCYSWDNGMGSGNNVNQQQQKEGMSTGKKLALGVGGTLATGAAAFAGARRGLFGNTARVWSNVKFGNLGASLKNTKAFQGLGDDMIKSASTNLKKGLQGQQYAAKVATTKSGNVTLNAKKKIVNGVNNDVAGYKDIWSSGGKLDMNTNNGISSLAKRAEEAAKAATK